MKSGSQRLAAACSAVVAGLLASASASATDLSYGVDIGVGHSDNIARAAEGEQDETIASVGGQLRLDHQSRRLSANVATRLAYLDYLDDAYDSDVVGNLIGNAKLSLVEERLSWTLDDTFGQVTRNQFAAASPDNRENVNFLSTGPNLTLTLGSRNKLLLNGRYSDVSYEESNLGNQRISGLVAVRRDLSNATNASVNLTTQQVSFEEDNETPDYDHHQAFLNYSVDAARTNLSIDAGGTRIESAGSQISGWLGRLSLSRRTSPSLTLGAELGHDTSDAGNAFVNLQANQPGSTEPVPVQQTPMPFENDYVVVFGRFSRNRTGLQLRVEYNKESYEEQPLLDRKRTMLSLSLDRNLNSSLNAVASANYSRQEYESLDLEFSDLIAMFGLRWKLSRATTMNLNYEYLKRSDDSGGTGYRANEVWLRFGYLVGEGAASGASL